LDTLFERSETKPAFDVGDEASQTEDNNHYMSAKTYKQLRSMCSAEQVKNMRALYVMNVLRRRTWPVALQTQVHTSSV